jgi:N-acyl-L-homoserine lactone synthetase
MYRILTAADRVREASLFEQMYRARAQVFHDRLGWDVKVQNGLEIDRYDQMDETMYIVTLDQDGRATGSLRLIPTTGDTMMKNVFADLFDEPVDIESPTTLECTRFVVHPDASGEHTADLKGVSSALLIGLCEMCLNNGYEGILGVYDNRMTRIYRRIGWSPEPLTESRSSRGHLIVGIWEVSQEVLATMRTLAAQHLPLARSAA